MSVTRRIAFGAGASWFSRGMTILLGLVLLPVLFRHLPKEELGVWLLLGQSWAAMGILDLGIGFTLTRRIALAKGKSGGDPNVQLSPESLRDIADLVEAGKRIYRVMAAGVFLVSWALGLFYLRTLDLHGLSHTTVWIAWTILCASQAITVFASVWTCLLQGVGYIGWDALIATLVGTATLTAQIVAVLCGGGLIALAAIATCGALGQRGLTLWFSRKRRPELFSLQGRWNPVILRGMPSLAFRAWLTAVGTVLVFNTDQFFIASSQGAEGIPAYRAAYIAVLNLNMLAVTFATASSVFISHLWQAREIAALHVIVRRNARLGLLIILCGSSCLLVLGNRLFDVWLGPGQFVGFPILIVFVVLLTLEAHSTIIVLSSRATEDEAFAAWSIAGGLLKLIASWILMRPYGLFGIAAGTLLAQLLTNHWYMVYRGLRRLGISFQEHFTQVLLPCVAVFVAGLAGNAALLQFSQRQSPIIQVIEAGVFTAVLVVAACWWLVLARSERARLLSFVGLSTSSAT
jgi:O-antigen/teichoic acid export membrane protein